MRGLVKGPMSDLVDIVKDKVLVRLREGYQPCEIWSTIYIDHWFKHLGVMYYVMAKAAYELKDQVLIDAFEEYLRSRLFQTWNSFIDDFYMNINLYELVQGAIPKAVCSFRCTKEPGGKSVYPFKGERVLIRDTCNGVNKSGPSMRCCIKGPINRYNISLFKCLAATCSYYIVRDNNAMPDDKSFEVGVLYMVMGLAKPQETKRVIECMLLTKSIEGLVKDILSYIFYLMLETSLIIR